MSSSPSSVLIAPINIAGQSSILARALRTLGCDAVSCALIRNGFIHDEDIRFYVDEIPEKRARKSARRRFFRQALTRYRTFHFQFNLTLMEDYRDLFWLRLFGKKRMMHFWGHDLRISTVARELNPHYNLPDFGDELILRRLQRVSRYVDTALVADEELAAYARKFFKHVVRVPQAIEIGRFEPRFPDPDNSRPLVVHAPSDPVVKGTETILAVVERLKSRHDFEFRLIQNMPHEEARAVYEAADIIVDQILVGSYGLLAVEAMALGKPILCFVREDLIPTYPAGLPVIPSSPDTLFQDLQNLLEDGSLRGRLGQRGREYAKTNHDSLKVARILLDIYNSL
ncbi:MAG: glycosyltransferase family 4 protein [Armatimonadetes bacterium]|nr:glycosyltransferase family 4 protein [Armatimonadota bacterium]